MRIPLTIFVFLSLVLTIGCSKNSDYFPVYDFNNRYVIIATEPMNLPGVAPFTMQYELNVCMDDPDVLQNTPVINASIDFGEGQGFVDITDKLTKGVWQYDLSDVYTYSEPGTYTLKARATYWDGEVITCTFSVPIVVLPPDEGDGA